MIKISSCITFFGNCKMAIDFYSQIFDVVDYNIITYGDMPTVFGTDLPDKCKELIYRSELNIKSDGRIFTLILSDSPVLLFDTGMNENPNNRDNISYEIWSNDKVWIEKIYTEFLKEGKRNIPLQRKDEYELSGSVMDKFGVCWILNYSEQ